MMQGGPVPGRGYAPARVTAAGCRSFGGHGDLGGEAGSFPRPPPRWCLPALSRVDTDRGGSPRRRKGSVKSPVSGGKDVTTCLLPRCGNGLSIPPTE
jgi:hypothetical protein